MLLFLFTFLSSFNVFGGEYSAAEITVLPQNLVIDGLTSGDVSATANSPGNITVWRGPLGRQILLSYQMQAVLNYMISLNPNARSDMAELVVALRSVASAQANVQVTQIRPIRGEAPLANAAGGGTAHFNQDLVFLSSPDRAFFAPAPPADFGFNVTNFGLKFHGIFPGLQGPIVSAIRGKIEQKAMDMFYKKVDEFQSKLQAQYPVVIQGHLNQVLEKVNHEIQRNMYAFKQNLSNYNVTGKSYSTTQKLAYQFRAKSNFDQAPVSPQAIPTDSRPTDPHSGPPFASVYLSSLYVEDILNTALENQKLNAKHVIGKVCESNVDFLMMLCNQRNFQVADNLVNFYAGTQQKDIKILKFYEQAKILFQKIKSPTASPNSRSERAIQVHFGEENGGKKDEVSFEFYMRFDDICRLLNQLGIKTRGYENFVLRVAYKSDGQSLYVLRRQTAKLLAFEDNNAPDRLKQVAYLDQTMGDRFEYTDDPKMSVDVSKMLLDFYRFLPYEMRMPSVPLFSLPGQTIFQNVKGFADITVQIKGINLAQNYLRAGALSPSIPGYLESTWSISNDFPTSCATTPAGQTCRLAGECVYKLPVYDNRIADLKNRFTIVDAKCADTYKWSSNTILGLKKDFLSAFFN